MPKCISFLLFLLVPLTAVFSQTREDLEKQRADLKKEIEQTEKLLKDNKAKTKENLLQWNLINNKVNLQNRVVDNLNKDLRLLDNNIYTIQKDINKYNRLLDTLKQEYAKSMIYAYKNRSNYDFLNFIFSADNFNDAIKRISYLKSYRSYREMQGQNILRTQELRKKKIEEISGVKVKKKTTLVVQNKEVETLETQKKEQDRILNELKKKGGELNKQMTAKQKQMKKVSNAIAAAIKKAQEEARKEAIARAKEIEKKKKESSVTNTPKTNPDVVNVKKVDKKESILLNADNIELNASFERNRGSLPWPVDNGYVLMHYGNNKLPSGGDMVITCTSIASNIGTPVKVIFDGEVISVNANDEQPFVVIQHGKYFTTYTNLSGINVSKGQSVKRGQVIGRVAANYDGDGSMDFYMSTETGFVDPEKWLRRK